MKEPLENQTRIILDSITEGVFTVDQEWKVTSFNRGAEKITGIPREEALNRHCWDVFRANICEGKCALKQTMTTREPIANQSIYIVNIHGERIPISISTALLQTPDGEVIGGVETFRDLSVVEELRKELRERHTFFDIISKNAEMHRLFGILEQVAESNATVLLVGESGTGKELFARAIHSLSPRKEAPIVTVNCGALPDDLLESELFGYKAGAFTDAKKDKPGRIAMAEGGTFFLDEIGNVSPALQVKLLRVLQEKVYEPLGSNRSCKANVRIVAATNSDLEDLVKKGKFRQDLYYRINVAKLTLPPLRERREDIPLLADYFISKFSRLSGKEIHGMSPEVFRILMAHIPLLADYFISKFSRLSGKEIHGMSPEVFRILMAHDFPGNIRELENIIEYATVVCRDSVIERTHLPDNLVQNQKKAEIGNVRDGSASWENTERVFLYEALERNGWNRKATAAELGVHNTTLWRKMKRLNLQAPKPGKPEPKEISRPSAIFRSRPGETTEKRFHRAGGVNKDAKVYKRLIPI